MVSLNLIGNIFDMKKEINFKNVLIGVSSSIIIIVLSFIIENEKINLIGGIKEKLYGLIALSFLLVLFNYKILAKLFSEYFKINKITLYFLFIELVLSIPIALFGLSTPFFIPAIIMAVLFFFSGVLRILIFATSALFYSDIDDFLKSIKAFAYIRAAYFSIGIILLIVYFEIALYWFFVPLAILYSWVIFNLSPYMGKQKKLREAINIIRFLSEHKNITRTKLEEKFDLSKEYLNYLLNQWDEHKFISINKKDEIQLALYFDYIKRGNKK